MLCWLGTLIVLSHLSWLGTLIVYTCFFLGFCWLLLTNMLTSLDGHRILDPIKRKESSTKVDFQSYCFYSVIITAILPLVLWQIYHSLTWSSRAQVIIYCKCSICFVNLYTIGWAMCWLSLLGTPCRRSFDSTPRLGIQNRLSPLSHLLPLMDSRRSTQAQHHSAPFAVLSLSCTIISAYLNTSDYV